MTILDRFALDGRVAILTGASSGLGVGFAAALAEAGADLVLGAAERTASQKPAPSSKTPDARRSPYAPMSRTPTTAPPWSTRP